jgi:outer membrane protein TolC
MNLEKAENKLAILPSHKPSQQKKELASAAKTVKRASDSREEARRRLESGKIDKDRYNKLMASFDRIEKKHQKIEDKLLAIKKRIDERKAKRASK